MTGLRIGLSGGWISLIASEMLGGSKGLGYSILSYSQTFRFPEMYATILLIAFLGLAMNVILAAIQRRLDYEEEDNHESRFIRFGDRAVGWALDSLFQRPHARAP
jgi:ABC-type nitrate/sulfonate/bicarbonate transport system permease component